MSAMSDSLWARAAIRRDCPQIPQLLRKYETQEAFRFEVGRRNGTVDALGERVRVVSVDYRNPGSITFEFLSV